MQREDIPLQYSVNFLIAVGRRSPKAAVRIGQKIGEVVAGLEKRRQWKKQHGFVPTNITFSPTYWCNLRCVDCYPDSSGEQRETASDETIDRAIAESTEKWSVLFYTISGGESLYHALKIAERNPDKLFQLYTNGTLITNEIAERIAQCGNLFPLVSIQGFQEETDTIRGKDTYVKVIEAMDTLTEHGVVWGIAFTLTSHNACVYDDNRFLDMLISKGAIAGRFLTYMPTGRGADWSKVPSQEQREKQRDVLRRYQRKRFYGLDYLNNPGIVQGCAASGLRYVHIDVQGNVYPCVFIPAPALFNLRDAYTGVYTAQGLGISCLEDILLKDPLLRETRKIANQRPQQRCCMLLNNPKELKQLYRNLAARYPVEEFGQFFRTDVGSVLLEIYREKLKRIAE
jgi:MoaA/NifB/PqqE/SkfB family radical SAM enzyme